MRKDGGRSWMQYYVRSLAVAVLLCRIQCCEQRIVSFLKAGGAYLAPIGNTGYTPETTSGFRRCLHCKHAALHCVGTGPELWVDPSLSTDALLLVLLMICLSTQVLEQDIDVVQKFTTRFWIPQFLQINWLYSATADGICKSTPCSLSFCRCFLFQARSVLFWLTQPLPLHPDPHKQLRDDFCSCAVWL